MGCRISLLGIITVALIILEAVSGFSLCIYILIDDWKERKRDKELKEENK